MLHTASQAESKAVTSSPASALKRTVQAALVAAVLVPLGSIAVEADSITCGFGEYSGYNEGCGTETDDFKIFNWGAYFFELTFEGLTGDFFITIDDQAMTPGQFSERNALPQNYECIPLTPGGPCIDFVISAPEQPGNWTGYDIGIFWNYDTNAEFPNGDGVLGQVRVLQNPGSIPGNDFTIDMCITFGGCTYDPQPFPEDPSIRTGDTDFSSMTVAWTPVPEPSTLIMLGIGVGGVLYRGRRRPQV